MSYSPRMFGKSGAHQLEEEALINDEGSLLLKSTPVRITATGKLEKINVSVESEVDGIAGCLKANITSLSAGSIIPAGLIENITTSATFGNVMWIDKSGDLTNVKPSIGVGGFIAGDFVIRIGVISKNLDNPVNKDLLVNITVIGTL